MVAARAAFAALASLALVAGCTNKEAPPAPSKAPAAAANPIEGTGSIEGRVTFEGARAPAVQPLKLSADPFCERAHPEGLLDDHYKINARGEIADVVVYVRAGLPADAHYPVPAAPELLDQQGCRYVPKVFILRAGQKLRIATSDMTLHNVHASAHANRSFNLGMPTAGMVVERVFERPEVPVRFGCDVHPWMASYAAVLDHPFGDVTGEDGAYRLEGLPDGVYQVEAWHPRLGRTSATLRLEGGGAVPHDFTLLAPARP